MPTGSGLDAQLVIGEEATWGTAVTPDVALEFNSESLRREPTWLEPAGLKAGRKYKLDNRTQISRETVNGDFTVDVATKGMGLLFKHCLGSDGTAAVVGGGTAAHEQYHVPGDFLGKSLTVQVGRPEPSSGTVRPFTYAGCKVISWEFSVSDNEVPTLQVTWDGRTEDTIASLVTPSYVAGSSVFTFRQASFLLGGTATTTGGKTSISGGQATANVINEVSISGESPKAVERFGIGNAGLKREQLENDIPTVTGSLSGEFLQEDYQRFVDNDSIPVELKFEGDTIEGSTVDTLSIIIPAVKIKTAAPAVGGPDLVEMSMDIEGYDDETNPPIQVHIISTDSSV